MVVSGRIVALIMIGGFVLFVGSGILLLNISKGREYNREITIGEQMKKVQLKVIQEFIREKKKNFGTFNVEDLNKLCGPYEYIYFPDHIKDMRRPLIMTKKEIVLEFKNTSGELSDVKTGIGFYVLFGDTLKVKTYAADKLRALIELEFDEATKTHQISSKYYEGKDSIAVLIKAKGK